MGIYKGIAVCKKHGKFDWTIVEHGKSINIKKHDKKTGFIRCNCPVGGCSVDIENYNFDNNE